MLDSSGTGPSSAPESSSTSDAASASNPATRSSLDRKLKTKELSALQEIYNVIFDQRGQPDVHISLASRDTILLKVQQNEFINQKRIRKNDFVAENFNTNLTAQNVEVVLTDDTVIAPTAIHRKTKIADSLIKESEFILDHYFHLELPKPISLDAEYTLRFNDNNLDDIRFRPADSVSLSIHHARAYDTKSPIKQAKLSSWTGHSGGGIEFEIDTTFRIRNETSGEIAYTGKITLNSAEDEFAGTDVFNLDFSQLKAAGKYRIEVDGIGKSLPFEIRDGVWESLTDLTLEGLYVHRAFTTLEPPYTSFNRPGNDDIVFYQSSVSEADFTFFDSGDEFKVLPATADRSHPIQLTGGWFDAGDYDTKVEHISIVSSLVDLYNSNPSFYQNFDPNIPESGDMIPDVLNEALWGMELYKNLQQASGAVSGGFEFDSHPQGTASWEEKEAFIYAPDFFASHSFAAAAAKLSTALRPFDAAQAQDLEQRAIRAMDWAEQEYTKLPDSFRKKGKAEDARQLAAVELYRLTNDKKYHDIFRSITRTKNYNASFVYSQLNSTVYTAVDTTWQNRLRSKLIDFGDKLVANGTNNGFDTINDPSSFQVWGYNTVITTQNAHYIAMAHQLTGDSKYLHALAASMQFGLGMNPDNMAYTTGTVNRGLAYDEPDDVLHVDGQRLDDIPAGITLYGFYGSPWFAWNTINEATDNIVFNTSTKQPEVPFLELFNDYHNLVPVAEYTVHQTIEDQVFAFGYLAGQASGAAPSPPEPAPTPAPPPEPIPSPTPMPTPPSNDRIILHAMDPRRSPSSPYETPITDGNGQRLPEAKQYKERLGGFIIPQDQVFWGEIQISAIAANGERGIVKSTHDLLGVKSYSYAEGNFNQAKLDNAINFMADEGGTETVILNFPEPVSDVVLILGLLDNVQEQVQWQAFSQGDNLIGQDILDLSEGVSTPALDADELNFGNGTTYRFNVSASDIERLELSALPDTGYSLVGIEYTPSGGVIEPALSLSVLPLSFSEDGGTAIATLTRTGDLSDALTVEVGSDDTSEILNPGSITIAAGESSASFTVTAADDAIADGPQTVTLTATAAGFTDGTFVIDVTDDEVPILTLSLDVADISENGGTATATLTRNTGVSGDLDITLTSDDTSEAMVPDTITIPDGSDSVTFIVTGVDDTINDGTQTPILTASAPGFNDVTASINVTDDDDLPTLTLSVDSSSLSENGGSAIATLTRTGDLSADLTVDISSDDTTEIPDPGSITIPAGDSFIDFIITTIDDAIVDGTQAVTLTVTGFDNVTSSIEVTDNELPTLELTLDSTQISENGGVAAATVTRNTPIADDLVVTLTSDNIQAATVPVTVTIPAGSDSAQFAIAGVDNTLVDGTRTPTITASASGFSNVSASLTILDDDSPTLAFNPEAISLSENGEMATVTVTRNTGTSGDLVISLSSSDVTEVTVPTNVIIILDGNDSATFDITGVDDLELDGTQFATITAAADQFSEALLSVDVEDDEISNPQDPLINQFDQIVAHFDGNNNDIDDVAALPITAVLANAAGIAARSTFFYNNNLGEISAPNRVESMRASAAFAERVGIVTYDYQADSTQATDALVQILNSGQKVLSLEGGPMEAIYRALEQVNPENLTNITLLSHGLWNETRDVVTVPDLTEVRTWADIQLDFPEVNLIQINDQNGVDGQGPLGFYSADWTWLDSTADPVLQATREAMFNAERPGNIVRQKINDASDAGMMFYALTGNETGTPLDAKSYLETNPPSFVLQLSLNTNLASISENGGSAIATLTRTGDPSTELSVDVSSDDTTAIESPGNIILAAGQVSVDFSITAVDDLFVDGTQTVTLTASAPGFTDVTSTVEVTDDEMATLTLTLDASEIPENGGSATATLTRNTGTTGSLEVTLTTDDDSEIAIPTSVTIPDGADTATFTINSVDDAIIDGTQTATITASADGFSDATAFIDVTSDDVPTLSFTLDANAISENGGSAIGTLTRSGDLSADLTVEVSSDDSTEIPNPDPITIAAGESSVDFTITSIDDLVVDGTQTVTLTASAIGFDDVTSSIEVTDDEVATLTLTLDASEISENGGVATATLTRNTGTTGALEVTLTTDDDSEIAIPTSVSIPDGADTATFTVNSVDDAIIDGAQTATITASADGFPDATVSIDVTNDDSPTLSLTIDTTEISENGGSATVTVTRTGDLSADLTVEVSSDDSTEIPNPGPITIAAGESSIDFTITSVDDLVVDGTQTVILTASAIGFNDVTSSIEVTDDEVATLVLTLDASEISENGGSTTATLARNTGTTGALEVTLTTDDDSEIAIPATITIPDGANTVTFTVDSVDDAIIDGTQTATITASADGFPDATASIDVTNDDSPTLSLTIDTTEISENGGSATVTMTRTGDLSADLTVEVSSDDSTEIPNPGPITIAAGESSIDFTITSVDDLVVDGTQTVILTASAIGFNDVTSSIEVTDDEVATLALTLDASEISENGGSTTATLTRNTGKIGALEVTLTTDDNSEIAIPATITIPDGAETITFTVNSVDDAIIDGTQTATITASADGFPDATASIDVTNDDSPTLSLTLDATEIPENSGSAIATLTRTGDLSADLTVEVSSDDSTEIPNPDPITIAAGESSVDFTITSIDDLVVDGTQRVTLTASAIGFDDVTSNIEVTDDEVATLTLTLDASEIPENGGSTTATLTRNTGTTGALTVTLVTNDNSEIAIPGTITIPDGEESVTFTVNSIDDAIVDGTQTATITASADGFPDATASIDVTNDDLPTLSLTLDATEIPENGGSATATLTRIGDLSAALTVNVSSSDTSAVLNPGPITIAAGQDSIDLVIIAIDDTIADGTQTATITASAPGFSNATASITVIDDELPALSLGVESSSLSENGGTIDVIVTRNTSTSGDLVVVLTSDDISEATVPDTVTILDGSDSATFTITGIDDAEQDGTQMPTVTASASGFTNATVTIDVTDDEVPAPPEPAGFLLTVNNGITLNGVDITALDIARYDGASYSLFFDGSDVGIPATADLDAFDVINDTEILMSFDNPVTLPGIGEIDDSDVVLFSATSLEENTAGTFSLYFDGSDVGLSNAGEDIDALVGQPDGSLLISVVNILNPGSGAIAANEDIVLFTPTSTGETTAGTFSRYFDGSDVGLESYALNGFSLDNSGDFLLTATSNLIVEGVSFENEDIFSFSATQTGGNTSGNFGSDLVFDGSSAGLNFRNVDGIDFTFETIDPPDSLNLTIESRSISEKDGETNATVTRSGDTSTDLTVTLSSSDITEAVVPTTVLIPAGQASTSFSITAVDDMEIDGTQTATITATATDFAESLASLTVSDDDALAELSITLDSNSISENGGVATATISRTGDVSTTLTVDLLSSNQSAAMVPTTAVIAAGETETTIQVMGVDDTDIDGIQTTTITASALGLLDGTATLNVTDDDAVGGDGFLFTLNQNITLNGLVTTTQDIVQFNGSSYDLFFDGSDVGLTSSKINAFDVISSSEILISFNNPVTIAGIGEVDDSDVVLFSATSLGENTTGSFSLFLDGSDVGLSNGGEDIDSLTQIQTGDLLLSTNGNLKPGNNLLATDEDLVLYSPSSIGENSAGSFSFYFDGSDIGLVPDVDGFSIDANGDFFFSNPEAFTIGSLSGFDEDILSFTPISTGDNTSGTIASTLFFDGDQFGLGARDIMGLDLTFNPV